VATVSLSFLNRRTINKQVCRVCHEFTELKMERLCADCTRIKAQLHSRFPHATRVMANSHEQPCKRLSCLCSGCDGRTLDLHPFYPVGPTRRELHFHPRCHELWLEIGGRRTEEDTGTRQG
jgi:hypothetical protein